LQPCGRQGNIVQTLVLIMVIACSRGATVRTLRQHRPDAVLFRKDFQRFIESQLHSSPSGPPQLASGRRLEKTESESIYGFWSLKIESARHVIIMNSVLIFSVLRDGV
jgi:hypothetical protein